MIKAASADTFGFDCVNLIKGILWGWNGDKTKTYGGAKYDTKVVPDINADQMIKQCSGVSSSGWDNMVPGEALWTTGHIGIYIGNGLAVESSPAFANKVQITAVHNIGTKAGYSGRTWKKHGRLPYVEYVAQSTPAKTEAPKVETVKPTTQKVVGAQSHDKTAAKGIKFRTTARSFLNVRSTPKIPKPDQKANVLKKVTHGTVVTWYGYYTGEWYLVQFGDKSTGYVHKQYLERI
jgi:hypothetical protein